MLAWKRTLNDDGFDDENDDGGDGDDDDGGDGENDDGGDGDDDHGGDGDDDDGVNAYSYIRYIAMAGIRNDGEWGGWCVDRESHLLGHPCCG